MHSEIVASFSSTVPLPRPRIAGTCSCRLHSRGQASGRGGVFVRVAGATLQVNTSTFNGHAFSSAHPTLRDFSTSVQSLLRLRDCFLVGYATGFLFVKKNTTVATPLHTLKSEMSQM